MFVRSLSSKLRPRVWGGGVTHHHSAHKHFSVAQATQQTNTLALNPSLRVVASVKSTSETDESIAHWRRSTPTPGHDKYLDFHGYEGPQTTFNEADALSEAHRCLKCADAPCQKSCPTQIDIKSFISAINSRNFYGAAQDIFSDNPLGISCGMVCPTSKLCAGGCNLHASHGGPIDIGGLQQYTTEVLKHMNLTQIRDPNGRESRARWKGLETAKIALIGAGPASISCATFLARLGYDNVTVFEKSNFLGGLSTSEIPEFRLPIDVVNYEVKLAKDLGVKFVTGQTLGKDFTIDSLRSDGYEAIFVGIGNPQPNVDKCFEGLTSEQMYFTSKDFLPAVSASSKPGLKDFMQDAKMPRVKGRVLVLGAGDTAMDCASSAYRCGASRVTLVLRRATPEIRASPEEFEPVLAEGCELLPFARPKRVLLCPDTKRITGVEFYKTEKSDTGAYAVDDDQTFTVQCDAVVSAFGSSAWQEAPHFAPLTLNARGQMSVNEKMETQVAGVFCGGDLVGSGTTVQATNDGKTASWHIHTHIQSLYDNAKAVPSVPELPRFYTAIDKVDVSVEFAGLKFKNPFGLASAPPTTSIPMIKRSYEQGWGFAVTKTFCLDKDSITNISPRITRGSTSALGAPGPNQSSFINIELISEKSADYWLKGIRELRDEFPDHITVASIMCGHNKEDWQELFIKAQDAGSHAIEMNLSCPHGMGEKGMGLACGQIPELVKDISMWAKEVAKIPFFIKLTPNVTEIVDIATAARDGGASGITAINTVSGLVPVDTPRPLGMAVGGSASSRNTTFGGLAGNATRPIALRDVSNISAKLPGFPIMGVGGVDSADSTLQFIRNGAGVVQVCSAVMNQDFTVVQDYISGLKTRLYMMNNPQFASWRDQSPPVGADLALKGSSEFKLPDLGQYRAAREEERSKRALNGAFMPDTPLFSEVHSDIDFTDSTPRPNSFPLSQVPTLNSLVGVDTQHNTGTHAKLPREDQVFAKVNEELCLNCGKCYMACNDSGYQAIEFDSRTHLPSIQEDSCTGCGLCISVCPAAHVGCITLEDRSDPTWQVNRS